MLWTRRTSLQVSLLAKMLQQLLRAGSLLRDFLGMTDVCKCQNEMTALSSGSVLYVALPATHRNCPWRPWRHRVETVNTPRRPATDRNYTGLLQG